MCVKVRKNLFKEKILEMGAFAGRSEGMRIDAETSTNTLSIPYLHSHDVHL
jgi:hypothetical protein